MEPTGETIRDIPVFRHQHKEKGIECQKEQCRKSMTERSNEVWKRIEENKKERLISKDSEEFLTKNNISISKVVDISLRELKHKLRKEVGAWK